MSTQWTDSQLRAINTSGNNVLVSAAAGSGKTAVLVERVIQKITDSKNPTSVDRLLIVTYTNAAAAEMRERIFAALTKEIAKNPHNAKLRNQLMLLGQAQITTIHAFCKNLIKGEFHRLGISADFEIGDAAVLGGLKKEALVEVLEEHYSSPTPAFIGLVDNLGGTRDDSRLVKTIFTIYNFMCSIPDADAWMEKSIKNYDVGNTDFDTYFEKHWGKFIIPEMKKMAEKSIGMYEEALDLIDNNSDIINYLDTVKYEYNVLKNIRKACDKGWDEIRIALSDFYLGKLKPRKTGSDPTDAEFVKAARKFADKDFTKPYKEIFTIDSKEVFQENLLLKDSVAELCTLIKEFAKRFSLKKIEKNVVDFNDLEHYALKLLSDENAAEEYRKRFDEILVDEFQDTNGVQSKIFESLSNGKNLFLVGDVKQSIYGFRNARPENFVDKLNTYSTVKGSGEIISLSHNFRSADTVIDVVNSVFIKSMSQRLGGIDYDKENMLVFGNDNMKRTDVPLEVLLTDKNMENGSGFSDTEREAIVTAKKIYELVNVEKIEIFDKKLNENRPIRYGDIAILLRSNKHADVFAKFLSLFGIQVFSESDGGYFNTTEIAVIMSYLEIIDNPMQDIPLLAVLRSPMVGFSDNELAVLRGKNKYASIYTCLKKSDSEKAQNFIKTLDGYIKLSEQKTVSQVINRILADTGYFSFVSNLPAGNERAANLRLLQQRASEFENNMSSTVSDFIRYVNTVKTGGAEYTKAKLVGENDDVVQIMTIHKSKGLEYPVVFVCKCASKFNTSDLAFHVLYDEQAGIGMDVIDINKSLRYKSVYKAIVANKKKKDYKSEEMRVMYVALTRARDRLYITADVRSFDKTIQPLAMGIPSEAESANTFIDWILPAIPLKNIKYGNLDLPEIDKEDDVAEVCSGFSEKLYSEVSSRLSYIYPYEYSRMIPSKMSVSEIAGLGTKSIHLRRIVSEDENNGMDAATRGTVIHFFMQNVDIAKTGSIEDINSEINRMVSLGMLTEEQALIISAKAIADFFASDIGERMVKSNDIRREYRFLVKMPAEHIVKDVPGNCDDTVIIQGIIDCFFEENGELVIIDYKTGSMREEYAKQIKTYEACIEKATGIKVKETVIYPLI